MTIRDFCLQWGFNLFTLGALMKKLNEYCLDFEIVEIQNDGCKGLYPGFSRVFAENKVHAINQVLDEWKDHPDSISHFEKVKKIS